MPDGGAAPAPPAPPGLPRPLAEVTATPRRYGFHATLKPPFRLAAWRSPAQLELSLAALARRHAPVDLPGLRVASVGRFLALLPRAPCPALNALAHDCVAAPEPFRAPPDAVELGRRRTAGLTPRQEEMLQRWGYPYVMAEFRFHITLTGPLERAEIEPLRRAAAAHFAPVLAEPHPVREICLFGEDAEGFFRLLHRTPLGHGG
ncbi:DUF1045 domain-containing protein [Maritimibacter sp. 55A14]|uniref:DUF1045 domain-containing protein n=1 Tax=Maritimibacter sp. 55A14 TaxID=2174844 RepID=UPI0026A41DC8